MRSAPPSVLLGISQGYFIQYTPRPAPPRPSLKGRANSLSPLKRTASLNRRQYQSVLTDLSYKPGILIPGGLAGWRAACGACTVARWCPAFGEGPTDPEVAAKLVKTQGPA